MKRQRRIAVDWNPGWRTKAIAAAVGGATALFSFSSSRAYGWWGSVICAAAALIVPLPAFRAFWDLGRFWITFAVLACAQVPLVIAVRPYVEKFRFGFMLAFGAADCILAIAVFYFASMHLLSERVSGEEWDA